MLMVGVKVIIMDVVMYMVVDMVIKNINHSLKDYQYIIKVIDKLAT